MTDSPHWVLGDWGTSRLRLFLASGTTIEDSCEGPGIGALTGAPLDALRAALAPWQARTSVGRVVLCGMAGSRNGLIEVRYVAAPADFAAWATHQRRLEIQGLIIDVCAGMSCVDATGAPDVMRGEETQIFGALRQEPQLAIGHHLMVLPGTHSKWVRLRDGVVVDFTTYITGELFALLREHSTLLRAAGSTAADTGGFAAGLRRSERCGSGLAAAAFETRSAQLLKGRSPGWATDFLSGLLIGAEVNAALEHDRTHQPVTVIGDPRLTAFYGAALTHYRQASEQRDGNQAAIAGLMLLAAHQDRGAPHAAG